MASWRDSLRPFTTIHPAEAASRSGERTVDEAAIIDYIRETYPDVDILTAGSGTFFSLDPEKHWPNFATLVTSDEYDSASTLSRPGSTDSTSG